MNHLNNLSKLTLSVFIVLILTACSNVGFIKRNKITRFGKNYRPHHEMLQTEGGAYFMTRNDTVFPSSFLLFNDDGSMLTTNVYMTQNRYVKNDSISGRVNHIPDTELASVYKNENEKRYDFLGLPSYTISKIYKISNDTIITQKFDGLYGKNIFGLQCWHYTIDKYIIDSDSSIIYISSEIYFDHTDDSPMFTAKNIRYIFHKTPYAVASYDLSDYRYEYPWLWEKRKEWKAWKKAHRRK